MTKRGISIRARAASVFTLLSFIVCCMIISPNLSYAAKVSKTDKENNLIHNLTQLQLFVNAYKKANNGLEPFWNCKNKASAGTPRIGDASQIDLNACGKVTWKSWAAQNHASLVTNTNQLPDQHYFGTTFSGIVFASSAPPDSPYGNDEKVGANTGLTGSGDWTDGTTKIVYLKNNKLQQSTFDDLYYSTTVTKTSIGLTFSNFQVSRPLLSLKTTLKISFDVKNNGKSVQTLTNGGFILKATDGSSIWDYDGSIITASNEYESLPLLKGESAHVVVNFKVKEKSLSGYTLNIPLTDGTLINLLDLI